MPITDQQHGYAADGARTLAEAGFRVETDPRNEKIGLKIREAEMAKVPYMVILGAREAQSRKLSVRKRSGDNLGELDITAFVDRLNGEAGQRTSI